MNSSKDSSSAKACGKRLVRYKGGYPDAQNTFKVGKVYQYPHPIDEEGDKRYGIKDSLSDGSPHIWLEHCEEISFKDYYKQLI